MLGGIGGVFRIPLFFLTISFSSLPLSFFIVPLASWSLRARSGHTPLPLNEAIHQQWKHIIALFLFTLSCAVVELILGIAIALWCGLESIPVFGAALYLFFSWIPTVLTLLMGSWFFVYVMLLFPIGVALAQAESIENAGFWLELPRSLKIEWVIRLKLFFLGIIPSVIFYAASTTWTMKGLPQSVEFCASIFRMMAFSGIEAPLFLFLIHMTVEADRYVLWLSSRRI